MNKIKITLLLTTLVSINFFIAAAHAEELTPDQQRIMQTCNAYINQSGSQSLSDYISSLPQKFSQQAESNLAFCASNNFCQYSTNPNCASKLLAWQFIQKTQSSDASTAAQNPLISPRQIPQKLEAVTQQKENTNSNAQSVYKIPPAGIPTTSATPVTSTPQPTQVQTQTLQQPQQSQPKQNSQQEEQQTQPSINW